MAPFSGVAAALSTGVAGDSAATTAAAPPVMLAARARIDRCTAEPALAAVRRETGIALFAPPCRTALVTSSVGRSVNSARTDPGTKPFPAATWSRVGQAARGPSRLQLDHGARTLVTLGSLARIGHAG